MWVDERPIVRQRPRCAAGGYDRAGGEEGDQAGASGRGKVNRIAALAMKRGKSVDFTGYWQRHVTGRRKMVPGARRINVSYVDSGT